MESLAEGLYEPSPSGGIAHGQHPFAPRKLTLSLRCGSRPHANYNGCIRILRQLAIKECPIASVAVPRRLLQWFLAAVAFDDLQRQKSPLYGFNGLRSRLNLTYVRLAGAFPVASRRQPH